MVGFAGFLITRLTGEFPRLFGGWQVDLAGSVVGAALAAAAAACWYVLRRLERTRAELGTFRRLMVLLAVLPGLVLGAALSDAAGRTVTWASDHTAQANADKALLASYRLTPPRMPSVGPAAPAAFARRLPTTADVGSGWYDVQQVNPASMPVTPEARSQGESAAARSVVSQEHRDGPMTWVPDVLVSEDLRAFDTGAHANAYLTSWRQNEESDALADRVFDGVSVTSGPTSTGAQAAFVVGTEAFTLRSTSTSVTMTAAAFDVLIQAAIMRAEPTA